MIRASRVRVSLAVLAAATVGWGVWAHLSVPPEIPAQAAEPSRAAPQAPGQPPAKAAGDGPRLASPKELTPFAAKHCVGCHSSRELKGGFDMESLLREPNVSRNPAAWHAVLERIASRDMPPAEHKARPTEAEYRVGEDWLRGQLQAHEALAALNQPRPMRRLNRDEYNRTIQAIFGLPGFRPADDFPPDDAVEGFTNVGEGLNLSAVLVDQYLSAGAAVARLALTDEPQPPKLRKHVFTHGNKDYSHTLRGHDPGGAVHGDKWIGDHLFAQTPKLPAGMYRVVLLGTPRGFAQRKEYVPNFQYRANHRLVFQDDIAVRDDVEFRQEFLVAMPRTDSLNLDMRWVNGFPNNNGLRAAGLAIPGREGKRSKKSNMGVWYLLKDWEEERKKAPDTPYPFPHIVDFRLEIEGPHFPEGYPLSRLQRENAAALAAKDARAVAAWLLPQLFRRPAKPEELAEFAAFAARAETQLANAVPSVPEPQRFPEALRLAIQQSLVSPHFLFLVEPGPVGRPLGEHELAVRLSYFLWSAPPDAELARLAAAGKLRASLAEQARRMLADPRSSAFLDRFTTEWLGLDRLATIMPEPELYRRFDNQGLLRQDMAAEPRAVMGYLLRENRSLYELLDADYAFLNDRLADHYHLPSQWSVVPLQREGFAPIGGGNLRKVPLPADVHRGGLVTMAAFLALASENTRTSPVRRGVWILEKLFNRSPPPPPPNVNGVLPDTNAGTTVSEKLKLHRTAPNCAGCHSRIDPLGAALENYDVIGEWRDRELPHIDPASPNSNLAAVRARLKLGKYDPLPTYPIDAGFSMGGIDGVGVAALKKYLLANKEKFARGFTEKLTTYALGRRHLLTDEPELERIRTVAAADGFRFQTLILALVQSRMFQSH